MNGEIKKINNMIVSETITVNKRNFAWDGIYKTITETDMVNGRSSSMQMPFSFDVDDFRKYVAAIKESYKSYHSL